MTNDSHATPLDRVDADQFPPLWLTLLLTAAAGGMGWGIRGQYGHETGAMLAGVLVAFVIGLLFCARQSSLSTARVVALTAVGISFGGAMTYGQVIGLTQNAQLRGNWAALGWGMVGLSVIGGIWVGYAGVLMGMGLGGKRYNSLEVVLLFLFLIVLYLFGVYLLNEPFDPASKRLPRIYFSADWYWQPDSKNLQPRREVWGGLLLALAGLWGYASFWKRDSVARNLGLISILFGAIGFPAGQSIQAYHSWNMEEFRQGWLGEIEPYMNWWNTMETVFGAILGLGLGLGVWMQRKRLAQCSEDFVEIAPKAEFILLAGHVCVIAAWNFIEFDLLDHIADQSLTMGLIPLALIVGGRYSPYLIPLAVVALPICGKTLREMSYVLDMIPVGYGWIFLFVLPMIVVLAAAIRLAGRGKRGEDGQSFSRRGLLLTSWLYFVLNFAFFQFPWPWNSPTARTPSAIVFSICLVLLTLASLFYRSPRDDAGRVPICANAIR